MICNVEDYLTPYKLDKPVLTGSGIPGAFDEKAVDCPFVFFHNDHFYMTFVGFDGVGYQTGLAESSNLIHWTKSGVILSRENNVGWDRVGAAGMTILRDNYDLHSLPRIKKHDGKYWMVYHSYPEAGYENGPASIGLAYTDDESLLTWQRLPQPVMKWNDGDSAQWESGGLYKGCLIEHGNRFYLFYNAKNIPEGAWHEQIGVAFSDDLYHWKRYEKNPVIQVSEGRWDSTFCSDPYIGFNNGVFVMYYFGFDRKHAQDGIAFSIDLLNWEKYPEPILKNGGEGALDENFAHKPSVIYHNGILYHFYCASRKHRAGDPAESLWNEFRSITVATSKPI
jgi:predicted GH43/DUF377 family glycosyl hydrolase